MAQQSGFFNALKSGEDYDRKYNADHYSDNMGAIISNGVLRDANNGLRVIASGGMAISVAAGRAWIEGRWYYNDTVYTGFTVPTAPAGDRYRIDRVILRLNNNVETRSIVLAYLQGSVSASPQPPELTREGGIYEIALADIRVGQGQSTLIQDNITDQRPNKEVCGWVTSPVGYDDYFANFDAEFNEWFSNTKNQAASVTLFKQYQDRVIVDSQTNIVTFNITQYDPSGVDIVQVYVNGIRATEGDDYTLSGSVITFEDEKKIGTVVDVYVYKSIDGTGLGSVSDEITQLQNQMATIKNIGEYLYICNGTDDNAKISEIAANFFNDAGLDANAQMTLNVYGTFGVSTTVSGSGTTVSRYRWLQAVPPANSRRRLTIDFLNASPIKLNGTAGNHYIGFYGGNVTIKNATFVVRHRNTEGSVQMFYSSMGNFVVENCRIDMSAYQDSFIAEKGTFLNCIGSVTNSRGDSYCFKGKANQLLRVFGGTYYAYTGINSNNASVFGIDTVTSSACIIANSVNIPTQAKTSHYQKNAINCISGRGSFRDIITALTCTISSEQSIQGTITASYYEDGDTYF